MTRAEHIKRLEELAARASLSPQIQPAPKPSPLTIKINEGLFNPVLRFDNALYFFIHNGNNFCVVRLVNDGSIFIDTNMHSISITSQQWAEMNRVRAALGWDRKE